MTLPVSVARCPGLHHAATTWPFPRPPELTTDCSACERRRQGIADYIAGTPVSWMEPPAESPCPEMLARKEKRNA